MGKKKENLTIIKLSSKNLNPNAPQTIVIVAPIILIFFLLPTCYLLLV